MSDHFGGSGGSGEGGGLTSSDVNSLILAASVNNLTNTSSSNPENTYSVVTFADDTGRATKRARISQDDLVENGRVIINSNTAQSIQFPETRGSSGYALTMHRDPVLAALGRTEWYSEAVVVPDDLQVSSISSLNPGVTPLEIKTNVQFTGGFPVDANNSNLTNITILDAVDVKATNSVETTLVKNDSGDLDIQALNDILRLEGDTTQITSTQGTTVTSAGGVTVSKGQSRLQLLGNENVQLFSGNGNIDVESVSGTVEVKASNDKLTLAGNTLDLNVVVGVSENKVLEIKNTGSATFNGSVLCRNNTVGIQGATPGANTALNFTDSIASARGNLTANDTTVVLEAEGQRRLKLIGDNSEYVVIDPGQIETPFSLTLGQPSTNTSVRSNLIVSGFVTTEDIVSNSLRFSCDGVEHNALSALAPVTIDVFDPSILPTPTLIDGQNRYQLLDNATYVFHGSQTYTSGFAMGTNTSIRGVDFSATIIFDETSADITGFYARDQNVYLSSITIVGGGGHFSANPAFVGLFDCVDFNLLAPPPFYGRNRRFKVTGTNIIKPRKFGKIQGFGTINITNNFFNGGGGDSSPGAVYTREGLEVSDGLSLEFTQNKIVLFYGATGNLSTGSLLNLVDAEVLLGFNAVTINNNIIHPRSEETGINFQAFSNTKLGSITGNNLIRTGGTGDLIKYVSADGLQNYNSQAVRFYEVFGNAGVADSVPGVNCSAVTSNSFNNTPITFDTENVTNFDESRRFGITYHLTGLGQALSVGQFVRISTISTTTDYLVIGADSYGLGGDQDVQFADFSAFVPAVVDITAIDVYDRDKSSLLTTATTCVLGTTGDEEIELVYLETLSPNYVIISANISITAAAQNDSHSFSWAKSTQEGGVGFTTVTGTTSTITPSRISPREFSLVVTVAQTMESGCRYRLTSTQVDNTACTITSVSFSGK